MPVRDLSDVDLPPFHPPYELAGSCFVAVGFWRRRPAHDPPPGFSELRVLGRSLAVVIANHYTKPPAELPIVYHEVIAASLVRRGLTVAAAPFDMVLDSEIPVELGREHYGMPKRLDPTLVVTQGSHAGTGFAATAEGIDVETSVPSALWNALSLPMRLGFQLAVREITASIDIVSGSYPPARRARIALTPRGPGRALRLRKGEFRENRLIALWCQSWDFTSTSLGIPCPLDGES